jgi:hypothetical protein
VGPMDPTPIDNHHDLFPGFAQGRHHLMDILTQLLGIEMGHNFIEDFGGAILDGTYDAEQYPAGDAAPRALVDPALAFEAFLLFDLALTQRACRQAIPQGATPPAQPGQGKAPQVCKACHDLLYISGDFHRLYPVGTA